METINEQLADLLEVDEVKDTDILADFECWDSLTQLSIIALVNEDYNVVVSAAEIQSAQTIGGLKSLINSKK